MRREGKRVVKILHIADLHLDAPFASCDVFERQRRRAEQREALLSVIRLCAEEKVQLLLIAGDLFDGDFIMSDTPAFLCECFSAIPETRVFISPGNHDPYYIHSPYRAVKFPDNVHIFEKEELECVDIPALNTAVYGFGFCGGVCRKNILENLRLRDETRTNILLCHADLDVSATPYGALSCEELEASRFDYAALGHIHKRSGFMRLGKTTAAYSGCLLGRGFDECGETGGIIGEAGASNVALKYFSVDKRRYEIINIKLSGRPTREEICEKILAPAKDFGEKCALRIVLSGSTEEKVDFSERDMGSALSDKIYFEIQNKTTLVPDIQSLLSENSLRGEFCRKIKSMIDLSGDGEREKLLLSLKYGIQALSGEDSFE